MSINTSSDISAPYNEFNFYYPKHTNERIIAQDGCFTIFPYPNNLVELDDLLTNNSFSRNNINTLRSIKIKANQKAILREQLSILGINQMAMYPGIEGITKYMMKNF